MRTKANEYGEPKLPGTNIRAGVEPTRDKHGHIVDTRADPVKRALDPLKLTTAWDLKDDDECLMVAEERAAVSRLYARRDTSRGQFLSFQADVIDARFAGLDTIHYLLKVLVLDL
jgi:hypothetical protein